MKLEKFTRHFLYIEYLKVKYTSRKEWIINRVDLK